MYNVNHEESDSYSYNSSEGGEFCRSCKAGGLKNFGIMGSRLDVFEYHRFGTAVFGAFSNFIEFYGVFFIGLVIMVY